MIGAASARAPQIDLGVRPTRAELPPAGGRIHLVGVAGAGMRGLALLLAEAGYRVSGCDAAGDTGMPELVSRGIELTAGHDPSHIGDADLIVYSAAVPEDSAELSAGREAGVPALKRARALGALLADRLVVGIAGTHGKTTITAMAGLVCEAAELEPTVVVGGSVGAWEGYARPGGDVAVVEADEYDRSFLELDPALAVVSSLEPEHLDCYGDVEALTAAYAEFASPAVERHGVLVCADDPAAASLGRELGSELSYGFSPDATYRLTASPAARGEARYRLDAPSSGFDFALAVPGVHNAQNAAAAFAVALRLGANPEAIRTSLVGFPGVERRLQRLAEGGGVAVFDDYAHHPTEVRASIEALRGRYPDSELVVVFQPHLFSRTRMFASEFAEALQLGDRSLVLPIYPARERPIPGVTSEMITSAADGTVALATPEDAMEIVREGIGGEPTVVAFMGAGDVTAVAARAAQLVPDDAVGG